MAQSQALQASLYPADSIHQVSAGRLGTAPNVLLGAVTALEPDTAIGCVGLMIEGRYPGFEHGQPRRPISRAVSGNASQ